MPKHAQGRRIAPDPRGSVWKRLAPAALCLLGALACLGGLLWEQLPYWEMAQLYDTAASPGETTPEHASGGPAESPADPDPRRWDPLAEEAFPGIVAWLRCADSELDYPVMQGEDNDYYLTHLPDGRKNKLGSIFLDCRSNSDLTSPVSVIYGHHARGGQMFGSLSGYKTQEYYERHPELELYTPQADCRVEVLAAYLEDGTHGSYPSEFSGPGERARYLAEVRSRSFIQSIYPWEDGGTEPLIILSTCSYEFQNARLALVGRLCGPTDGGT